MAKLVDNEPKLENEQVPANEKEPRNNGNKQLTQKQKLIIICVAAAVAVILAIVIPIAVVFGGKKPKYTVTFDTRGGSEIASYTLEAGETITRPESNPAWQAGDLYMFDGWYTDETWEETFPFGSTMPSHDVTVYAKWNPRMSVNVFFDANGGSFDESGDVTVKSVVGNVGDRFVEIDSPKRYGYVFGGWCTDAEGYSPFEFVTYPLESFTLYAKWDNDTEKFAYVSFYGNGVLLDTVPVAKGAAMPEYDIGNYDKSCNLVGEGKWYTDSSMQTENTATAANGEMRLYTTFYSAGLTFENATVTGYTGTDKKVYVPSRYNGRPVTVIGENAFYRSNEFDENYGNHITEIVLPATITTIDVGAFYDCRYLETVNLTSRVRIINDNAFWHNERLKNIGDISNVTTIGDHAFAGCDILRDITLPDTLTTLGNYAFADCKELRETVVPASVKAIGDYAFDGCVLLETVEIQATDLTSIGAYAFRNCASLTQVVIRSARLPEFGLIRVGNLFYSPFRGCIKVSISVTESLLSNYKVSYGDCDDGALNNKFTSVR